MCGIVGIISFENVASRLVEGLKRLEYRGYDSSGIATIHNGTLDRRRAVGKLTNLEEHLKENELLGFVGIGHTRWATHGKADTQNAHPHANDRVAVVHNGIIENFSELKKDLLDKGYIFESETDTEVVVHLLTDYLGKGLAPLDAFQHTLKDLKGAFALGVLIQDRPDLLLAARCGSPLVLGYEEKNIYIGSDAIALAPWTTTLCYLAEGDLAVVEKKESTFSVSLFNALGEKVERPIHKSKMNIEAVTKGGFSHYMLKEIYEQPEILAETLESLVDITTYELNQPLEQFNFTSTKRIAFVACGTSYYACMVAKYWFEKIARISVEVHIASEFRYAHPVIDQYDLTIVVSQSGETIDTLWALKQVKEEGGKVAAIVNVDESSIARACDYLILTQSGPEIGVASTKAFTSQLLVLSLLVLKSALDKNLLSTEQWQEHINALIHLPSVLVETLQMDHHVQDLTKLLVDSYSALYLGRGTNYPIALEGALKIKEIAYIHAHGYAAGELKHGPIALIDRKMPVIVIAPFDEWFEKTLSNVQEVLARGAYVIALTDQEGEHHFRAHNLKNTHFITLKSISNPILNPIVYSVLIQLLAYYTAYFKGTDIDQPRNLAKSVTVE